MIFNSANQECNAIVDCNHFLAISLHGVARYSIIGYLVVALSLTLKRQAPQVVLISLTYSAMQMAAYFVKPIGFSKLYCRLSLQLKIEEDTREF